MPGTSRQPGNSHQAPVLRPDSCCWQFGVTPLLAPAMVAVIGPVEPDPAATTLVSVTFWIALNPDPPLRNVRQGVVTVESPVSLN